MREQIIFALDKNLGFPIEDPKWQAFFNKHNIVLNHYLDMKKMTADLQQNPIGLSYLPTANYYYLRNNESYTPVANALFTANQTSHISSVLVVSKKSNINSLDELKDKRLGYINLFCTSSYFAPAILLWQNHYSIDNFFSKLQEVGAWQRQVDAVIAGEIDATMVQEDIWHKLPENAEKTEILGKVDNLPSPLLICSKQLDQKIKDELTALLFHYTPKASPEALFNGFIPYHGELVHAFFDNSEKAFKIKSASLH
ncbi:MAG: PhnD/SsuA/transferrin family substrate-binding protein [Parachlamydiales bacterium]|jgi:phosphonate transport system substrate-binding protein